MKMQTNGSLEAKPHVIEDYSWVLKPNQEIPAEFCLGGFPNYFISVTF